MARKRTSKSIKNACDKLLRLIVIKRDADANGYAVCCSCGKIAHYTDMDAGHWINRGCMKTRYELKNVHLQCRHCNRYREGNGPGYSMFMLNKYGTEVMDDLIELSKMICQRKQKDWLEVEKWLKGKL